MEENIKLSLIERFDSLYSGINNKGTFILTLNTFVITIVITGYVQLNAMVDFEQNPGAKYMIGVFMLLSFVSILLAMISIFPYVKSSESNKTSTLFFGAISKMEHNEFVEQANTWGNSEVNESLMSQIYFLAKGLTLKHRLIQAAVWSNLAQALLLLYFFYVYLY